MRNLAGVEGCDEAIHDELTLAGVPWVRVPRDDIHSEVPYTIEGRLGRFKFRRAWRYWVVEGPVPIEVACELYVSPVGRKDVRAGGDCTCPHPDTQAEWLDSEGVRLYPDPTGEREAKWREFIERHPSCREEPGKFVPDPSVVLGAHAFVTCYHIDSQQGLNLFVQVLKKMPSGPLGKTAYERLLEPEAF